MVGQLLNAGMLHLQPSMTIECTPPHKSGSCPLTGETAGERTAREHREVSTAAGAWYDWLDRQGGCERILEFARDESEMTVAFKSPLRTCEIF